MALGGLRRRADALAAEAARLKSARNVHLRRSLAIVRQRIASPAGLSLCFAAGFALGKPDRPRGRPAAGSRPGRREREPALKALAGPLAAVAVRLASAFLGAGAAGPAPLDLAREAGLKASARAPV